MPGHGSSTAQARARLRSGWSPVETRGVESEIGDAEPPGAVGRRLGRGRLDRAPRRVLRPDQQPAGGLRALLLGWPPLRLRPPDERGGRLPVGSSAVFLARAMNSLISSSVASGVRKPTRRRTIVSSRPPLILLHGTSEKAFFRCLRPSAGAPSPVQDASAKRIGGWRPYGQG